jgi:hypothetical protein
MSRLIENEDYYLEEDRLVFTMRYHLKRGSCCGSGCRHCPYEPRWVEGTTAIAATHSEQPERSIDSDLTT